MHLQTHLKYRGAKPRGEVAKPKSELAHRDQVYKGGFRLIHLRCMIYKHLKYRGAKPRGEVAKPKTELAHRDRFIKVAYNSYIHLHIYVYTYSYR